MQRSVPMIAKQVAAVVASTLVLPAVMAFSVGAAVLGREKAFQGWSQLFGLLPGLTGVYLRRAFYHRVLMQCDEGACISFGTVFSHSTAKVGRHVYVGVFCVLGDVTLDDDVLIGSHVSIMNGSRQHWIERLDVPVREQPGEWPRVTIGQDTWVGDRAVIMADVGRHCVVAAGAVVTKPVPDYTIVAGIPAKMIGRRGGNDGNSERNGHGSGFAGYITAADSGAGA